MTDRTYVLGTSDDEINRLGLQHRLWRDRVHDAWSRAAFGPGKRIIDVGAGPGFAAIDLAETVGPTGRVIAIERSGRFLERLRAEVDATSLSHVEIHEADLDDLTQLPASNVDGVWCRWILAFVRRPEQLVTQILDSLKPGGVAVLHEYLNYATWRLMPPVPSFEEFVSVVMSSWRKEGGEPDIAAVLPHWFDQAGADVVSMRPYVDVVTPSDALWQWPAAFVHSGLDRLVELGRLDDARAQTMRREFGDHSERPGARMVTPMVLELLVRKR